MNDIENKLPNEPLVQDVPEQDTTWPEVPETLPKEIIEAQEFQRQAEEAKQQQEPESPRFTDTFKPTPQDSFRTLKAKAERLERERDQAARRIQELESRMEPEEDLSVAMEPDEIAEGKHLSKVQKQIVKLQKQIQESERRNQDILLESRLKRQYPDFDEVVSSENIEQLKENDPESALIVDSIPNVYTKALAAYKAIKSMNVNRSRDQLFAAEKEKAQRNASKPRPSVSINPQSADNPLSRVNAFADGLTPELEKQLLKEMHLARQNR